MTKTMERILRKEKSGPQSRASSLGEKLRSQTRLLDTDKKILAENLGRICEELNPDKPLAAAMALIEKSQPNLRQKRKRYIRLPGEDSSPDGEKFAYGSTGVTFANLAETASQMRSTSNDETIRDRDRDHTFRTLFRGTSFSPVYKPDSVKGRSTKDILDEYAERICDKVAKETRILELWDILKNSPVSVRTFVEPPKTSPQYSDASIVPKTITKWLFDEEIESARFSSSPYSGHKGTAPFRGDVFIKIGTISTEMAVKVLNFSDEVRAVFSGEKEGEDFSDDARKWLDGIDYLSATNWEETIVNQVNEVALVIYKSAAGKPSLAIKVLPSEVISRDRWLNEEKIIECLHPNNAHLDYLRFRFNGSEASLRWIPVGLMLPPDESERMLPLGKTERFLLGWTEDSVISELLLSDNENFENFEITDYSCGVFHRNTAGGALIGNLMDAEDEERIDRILIERARLLAEAGIGFYEAKFDEAREALLKISEG